MIQPRSESRNAVAVYIDQHMQEPVAVSVPGGRAVCLSRRMPEKTTENEDAAGVFVIDDSATVIAVADGMGGGAAGQHAAAATLASLERTLKGVSRDGLRAGILDGIEKANEAVRAMGVGAGTTFVAVEIADGNARSYHVGDSMAMIVGGRGKLKLQTVMHSPVGYAVESGHLDAGEAMHHEDRHIVSNVVGDPAMRIEISSSIALAPQDTVLLGSDGLFDNLAVGEIIAMLRHGGLRDVVQSIGDEATRRMTEPTRGEPSKADDLTVLAFRTVRGA